MTRPFHLLLVGLLVLTLLFMQTPAAFASSTWYVNAATGSDNDNCLSHKTACKTIGHAISLAASGDTIKVAAGTYTENLTLSISLIIAGAGAATTIIDGGKVNTVVNVNAGTTVTLSGLTIQNGSTTGNGGGINNSGTLSLASSTLSGNSAFFGGGIDNSGTLTLINTTLSGNSVGDTGGGIYIFSGTVTLTNSTVSGNSGIGIDNYQGTLTVSNSTIAENGGSGINLFEGTLTVSNSTISSNSGTDGEGGGIAIFLGTTTINNSTIAGNSASGTFEFGGGIWNDGGTLTINNSTLSGNSVTNGEGGGIYNLGTLTITNSTLSGNSATAGGGISNGVGSSGTVALNNTTFANNTAHGGGSLVNGRTGSVTLQNTLLGNKFGLGINCAGSGTYVSNGYNLSSDNSCSAFLTNTGDMNDTNPLLGQLKSNGGPTQTQALLAGSPAIDAGNPGPDDGQGNDCMPTDQRGVPRPQPAGGRCDIGAYERK